MALRARLGAGADRWADRAPGADLGRRPGQGRALSRPRRRDAVGAALRAALATPAHPAPAVLVSHGFINTREMQSPFAIELARRGFVVLAMDMTGHGYSGGPMGDRRLRRPGFARLPARPAVRRSGERRPRGPQHGRRAGDGRRHRHAGRLQGRWCWRARPRSSSARAPPAAPASRATWQVVFGQYDEFAPLMWGVAKGADVGRSPKLETIFGSAGPVAPGQLYGDIAAGTGAPAGQSRPSTTRRSTSRTPASARRWTGSSARSPARRTPRPPGDQIWFGKEIGTLAGFVGCVVLMLGTFELALAAPPFRACGARRSASRPVAACAGWSPSCWPRRSRRSPSIRS